MSIDPEVGKAALRIALFIVVLAGGMLLFLTPGSPQFYITVFTLLIGLLFVSAIVFVVRRFSK